MDRAPGVVVHADKQELAVAAADRLVTAVVEAQTSRGVADVVLTGGSMGEAVLSALAGSPGRDVIDWPAVRLWWGDERFLPDGDPDRNETQARAALLDRVDLRREHVHPVPAADSGVGSAEEAAEQYAAQLAAAAESGELVPRFDVLLLGVGPDAHVASLFPGHPALYERERAVVAVHGSPKPPPDRVSLTFPALCSATDVWFIVSGGDKADAVGLALSGAGEMQAPAAGVHGLRSTVWLVDRPAAQHVPPELVRLASP